VTKAKDTDTKDATPKEDAADGEDVCPVCGRKGRPPGHH
jgi:hypothetical protein